MAVGVIFGAIMTVCGLLSGWQILSTHRASPEFPTERDEQIGYSTA